MPKTPIQPATISEAPPPPVVAAAITALPSDNLPATVPAASTALAAYGAFAGQGFEGIGKDDLLVPMIRILQANSPQIADPRMKIPGAEAGMFYNNVTQRTFDGQEGFYFVMVGREHNFVRYVPRDAGGGMTGIFLPDDKYVIDAIRSKVQAGGSVFGKIPCIEEYRTNDGRSAQRDNELVETFYLYGPMRTDDYAAKVVIPFTSTQIKKYKGMMTALDELRGQHPGAPTFAYLWKATTVWETKKGKGDYWGWNLRLAGAKPVEFMLDPEKSDIFRAAVTFYDVVKAGKAKAAHVAGGADEGAPDEAPF